MCALSVIAIILFAIWMASFLPLVLIPFAVDIYWTCFIPWTWWRSIKNVFLREMMSWIDAIVFGVVAVWVLQNFFIQNFQIPTTSLEKTMMAGDYLVVSKFEYGPRKPMTPLALPFFQHTVDLFGSKICKSYFDFLQYDYERMPGLNDIKRGDIVVFNYPLGDSIMVSKPEQDYYQTRTYLHDRGLSVAEQNRIIGEVINRPVDRRENYVKRCVGLPGETLQIVERQVYIDGQAIENPKYMQSHYLVYTNGAAISSSYWKSLDIYVKGNGTTLGRDVEEISAEYIGYYAPVLGIEADSVTGAYNHLYMVNMTAEKAEKVAKRKDVEWVRLEPVELESYSGVFPNHPSFRWKANNFGPIWIPKAGESIELTSDNVVLYGRCIRTYEGNTLVCNEEGKYLLNGKEADSYTFKMDYYWMMGDNRDNSADSRFWGFVPEDHIVGTPILIWMSINQETGAFRWDRFLKSVSDVQ